MSLRLIKVSNEVIHIQDASPALPGRYICLELFNSFFGQEDQDLTERLLAERSGILNLALDALDRLRARGKLLQPKSGEALAEELAILSNFMLAFGSYCIFEPQLSTLVDYIYQWFLVWCERNRIPYRSLAHHFSNEFRDTFPHVRPGKAGGDRMLHGVKVNEEMFRRKGF